MPSLFAVFTSATATPIVGGPHTSFATQEWIAGGAVAGLAVLLVFCRRYASARTAGWDAGNSFFYAAFFNKPPNTAPPSARGLLVGQDNRMSTSKTTAAMWTVILLYFILVMALVLGFQRSQFDALIGGISPIYLVFLGGPFAAAVLAKASVSNAVNNQQQQKSQASSPSLTDVFSDDDGNTDLVDLQYVAFNVLVAGIVLVEFIHAPGFGAPTVPSFLAALTGTSAATYVGNKTLLSGNPPAITRLAPSTTRAGGQITILGTNLIAQGDTAAPTVFVDNGTAITASDMPARSDQATVRLPAVLAPGARSLALRTPSGLQASSDQLQIVPDALTVAHADPTNASPSADITLSGAGFYYAADVDALGAPRAGAVPATATLTGRTGAPGHDCVLVTGTDTTMRVRVPDDILTRNGEPAGWFDLRVQRGGLVATPNIAIRVMAP